jgi:hypothetical protein
VVELRRMPVASARPDGHGHQAFARSCSSSWMQSDQIASSVSNSLAAISIIFPQD